MITKEFQLWTKCIFPFCTACVYFLRLCNQKINNRNVLQKTVIRKNEEKRQTRAMQLLISHSKTYSVNKSRGLSNNREKSIVPKSTIDHMCEMNRRTKTHNGRLKNGIWFNPSQNCLTYDGFFCWIFVSKPNGVRHKLMTESVNHLQPFWRMSSIVCLFMVKSATCLVGFFSVPFPLLFGSDKKEEKNLKIKRDS